MIIMIILTKILTIKIILTSRALVPWWNTRPPALAGLSHSLLEKLYNRWWHEHDDNNRLLNKIRMELCQSIKIRVVKADFLKAVREAVAKG